MFLVRRTQRDENILVLSLTWSGEFFNYEICIRELPQFANHLTHTSTQTKYFFIDDGPYFKSLEHLVEHYTKYEDGLPGLLTRPIANANTNTTQQPMTLPRQGLAMPPPPPPTITNKSNKPSGANIGHQKIANNDDLLLNRRVSSSSTSSSDLNAKSSALTKASLFKSRTLLNDQSKCSQSDRLKVTLVVLLLY